MKKKSLLIMILILIMMLLTGCWNNIELDRRAFVMGLGIDKGEDGNVLLSAQILKPAELKTGGQGGGGSEKAEAVTVVTSTGETIFDAIRNFTLELSRKLYFQHNRILVISEEIAKEGVYSLADIFIRDYEMKPRFWVLVTDKKAKDVLEAKMELNSIPAFGIEHLLHVETVNAKTLPVNIHHFMVDLSSSTQSPVATKIEVEEKEEDKKIKLAGTAVFKRDKLMGYLDETETRGLLWIKDHVESGIIVVDSPKEKDKQVSLEILRTKTEIKAEKRGRNIVIVIEIEEKSALGEQESIGDLTTIGILDLLEKKQANRIEDSIRACLFKTQRIFKSDIFGFGDIIHRNFPQDWKEEMEKDWDELFPEIEVEIKVHAQIVRSNVTTGPVRPK